MGKSSRKADKLPRRVTASPANRPATVMIADDQPLVLACLAMLVAAQPRCVVVAEMDDALRLLEAAEQSAPTIAIIDATMAQSVRVARLLAARCPQTKVVLLGETADDAQVRRAIDCGAAAYVTKAATPAEFSDTIARVVRGERGFFGPPTPLVPSLSSPTGTARQIPSPEVLTARELEILAHLAAGSTVRDCAAQLSISPNTVENHKARIMRKLGLHKTVDLTRFAIRHGIVSDDH